MLRMVPPVTPSRASVSGSRSWVGVSAGNARLQIAARWATSGKREMHDETDAPHEGGVERLPEVRGQDRETAIGLHARQQVTDLDVGVTVVAVRHLAAFAEQGVGFVEQQDRAALLGRVEDPPQVLLGLADVLADHATQIDAVEIERQLVGDHLGRQGLAGAALAVEQRAHAEAAIARSGRQTPGLVDPRAVAELGGDLAQGCDVETAPPGRPSRPCR